jgi:hypothetical protein
MDVCCCLPILSQVNIAMLKFSILICTTKFVRLFLPKNIPKLDIPTQNAHFPTKRQIINHAIKTKSRAGTHG